MSSESEAAVKNDGKNLPLKSLGKYLIERKLGQGGMGTVYLAKHVDLKKLIALKVLPQDKAKNPILVRRFKAEAQAAAQLEHPNIVAVYDTGEADGYLYIAMEFVDGIDLFEQVKRRGVIPVKRSIEIMKQVASALQEASEKNIVHRDIKPSNLLLRHDGVVKVTDLGLARSIDETLETDITRAGTTVGTVDYMAPEQARNSKAADIRSDIYSLGCTWYQMLTGQPPFPEGSLTNKLQAHAIKPLPDPRELNENIPEGLFAILQRMTAKKPEDRYQTPAELLDELKNAKLTKAAFSNEIFSDLSDYNLTTTGDDSGDEDQDPGEEDFSPVEDEPPRKKSKSRIEEEFDEAAVEPTRRKKPPSDSDPDEPTKRKSRSRDTENPAIEDTQPLRARKVSAKALDEDADEVRPVNTTPRTSSKRNSHAIDEDELDEPSPVKRKKSSLAHDDDKVPSAKSSKSSTTNDAQDKKASKNGQKSLPPKRQPLPEEKEQSGLNLEALKFIGIAAGVLFVIGGLGWMIFQWSGQLDVVHVPHAPVNNSAAVVAPVAPVVKPPDPNESNPVTVTVVDPPKVNNVVERMAAEFDITKQPMPTWANEATEPRDLPVFTVGPGLVSETHFANIDDALRASDKNGGVIRLLGNGPFLLSNVELGNAKRLVIMSATPQDLPLIILKTEGVENASGLTLNNGTLDLRGLHFALDRSANSNPRSSVFVTVSDGQLFARNCSFTATGSGPVDATALAITSKIDAQLHPNIEPDVLLDRVTVRGNGLTGLKIHRTNADVVIQNSLMITGTAPAIDVASHMAAGLADTLLPKPRRMIRVVRTTLCARTHVLELGAETVSKPPTTALLFQDSVCSAEGSGNSAVLASATQWPSITSTSSGWLTNLTWSSMSSLYLGFDRLLDLKSSYQVHGLDDWQRVWGKKYSAAQFQSILWQESVIPDLSAVMPYDFNTAKLPYHDVKTGNGGLPGCAINLLTVPGVISQARLLAINERPKLPTVVQKPADSLPPRKVDLGKEDLGQILNRNDWASGSVFEATGSGIRFMSPAKIAGKSLRIIFRQGDGAPLKIQPKIPEQKAKPDSLGLFNIENGSLYLQSATLESVQTVRNAAPPWLISAKNASVVIKGCQLNGPMQQELEQHQGLILWSTTLASQPTTGTDPMFLSVNDSVMFTSGSAIRAECSQGNVFLRNCIVAVRGYGLNLLPTRLDNKLLSNVDLDHVTFSTSKAAIRVEAAGNDPVTTPMRLFADYCAIVAPLEFKSGEAAESSVIECVGPVRQQKQIEWWGNSNAIAKDVKILLRQSDSDPITAPADWQNAWGESNDIRLLTGPKGVQLSNSLPNKWNNLKPASFVLDPKSISVTWADGGRPVGADIRVVEDSIVAKKAMVEPKPTVPASAGPPKPVIKKDVGF